MKKVVYFLVCAALISVNTNSQNVVNLGIKMIESDIFEAKRLLQWEENGFDVSIPGSDIIIGMKGSNPNNSIMFVVKAWGESLEQSSTKEVKVTAAPMYAKDIEPDLKRLGYVKVKEQEEKQYIHTYIHKTYQKNVGKYTNIVVVHFGKQSGVMGATFTRQTNPAHKETAEQTKKHLEDKNREMKLEQYDKEFYDFIKRFTVDQTFRLSRITNILKDKYPPKEWGFLSEIPLGIGQFEYNDFCYGLTKESTDKYYYFAGWCESEVAFGLHFSKIQGMWYLTEYSEYSEEDYDI